MKQKKIPLRRCNGCNEMKPKKELVRVVRSPEGEVSLDLTGRKPGRGAYVCRSAKAIKSHRFEREFNCEIPQEVYDLMEKEMDESGE